LEAKAGCRKKTEKTQGGKNMKRGALPLLLAAQVSLGDALAGRACR